MPTELLAKLIHLEHDREMTFLAQAAGKDGQPEALSVVDAVSSWCDEFGLQRICLTARDRAGPALTSRQLVRVLSRRPRLR